MTEDYRTEQEKEFQEIKETAQVHRDMYRTVGAIALEIADILGVEISTDNIDKDAEETK